MKRDSAEGRHDELSLPPARHDGTVSLEKVLSARRSIREFSNEPLDLEALAQLAWSAQGLTDPEGLRTAPSAGALYPLELFVVTSAGCYRYDAPRHCLLLHERRDLRPALCRASLSQPFIRQAAALFVFAAVARRTEAKYGVELSPRYIQMEIGHAAQNLLLQAVALGLGGVPVGAFHEDRVKERMRLPADHQPLYMIAVGHPERT